VAIDQNRFTRSATQQLIKRHVEALGLDIPECGIDGSDGAHGDRTATPISAFVKILPGVLDFASVAVDEQRKNVVSEETGNGELGAVQGGVAKAIDAVLCSELEGDEISARRADVDFGVDDLHGFRRTDSNRRGRRAAAKSSG